MKITDKQRREIRNYVQQFRRVLYLHLWTLDIRYMDDDEDGLAAAFSGDCEYYQGAIKIYPCFWKEAANDRKKIILHEMLHGVLADFQRQYTNMSNGKLVTRTSFNESKERTTTHLTNIIFDLV